MCYAFSLQEGDNPMRMILAGLTALALSATAAVAEMTLSFSWGATPACNTGRAMSVDNPPLVLRGVPAGTTSIELRMQDLDAPRYNHGGARLRMTRDGQVPPGTFTYKGPCPPNEVHTYEWTATARSGNQVLARATVRRRFPE